MAYLTWFYAWFDWFGANAAVGGGYSPPYTWSDYVRADYIDQPSDSGVYVTFTEYAPKGWLGWCTVEGCEGQSPRAIQLGWEYNAEYYYFVYYATYDALDGALDAYVTEV